MAVVIRNLIQYDGIEECIYTDSNFKQFNVDNTFAVPVVKPDIEQIVKVWARARICSHKIIKTPVGESLEGQVLNGYKLIFMGEINMKYEYVALKKEQSVHTAHNIIPFCSYIVMPKAFNQSSLVTPILWVEDIYSELLNTRCIYSNITLMANAEIC